MSFEYDNIKTLSTRRNLRNNMTPYEQLLWERIRRKQLNVRFRRQHSIGRYVADFYCPSAKLVIEVDGGIHSEKESIKYDQIRTAYFNALGIHVLRFSNSEVSAEIQTVIQKILKFLDF